jgi:hypothetical protein
MLETGSRRFQTVKKTARTRKRFIALAKCAPSSFDLPYFRRHPTIREASAASSNKMHETLQPRQQVY